MLVLVSPSLVIKSPPRCIRTNSNSIANKETYAKVSVWKEVGIEDSYELPGQ